MQQLLDNRYRLLRPLGSGGMADVYLAHDDVLDRDVALKVMSSRYADDEEFVERFRREAQNAAALSHPNIVSIYDRGTSEDGYYYIAMEYLSGGTLKDEIVKRGALPARTAAAVALQIAEALQVAHKSGVVHRDIKPHNILITASGDIKVTDFGIARAASSSTMTKTGSILGTAHYISPEQAMGHHVGPQSDLYSLGVVLYEMITGELPYDADSPIGVAMKHVNGNPRPPTELDPSIPAGISAITMRLLAKDPRDRYADDAGLIEDLERVGRGLQPTETTRRMNRVVPPAGVPGATAEQTRVAPPPAGQANGRTNGRRFWSLLPLVGVLILLAVLAPFGYSALRGQQAGGGLDAVQDPLRGSPSEPATMLTVPDLTDMTLDEAREEYEEFEIVVGERREGTEPEDTILQQAPAPGDRIPEGENEIRVAIVGTRVADVPDVLGWAEADARQAVEAGGFEVEIERQESSWEEQGLVTGQDPEGGERADAGSEVELVVGDGPSSVEVPNVYGYTPDGAAAELRTAGLVLGSVNENYSDDVEEGRIFLQDPAPGADAEPGTEVDVVVSRGPSRVTVPDVVGQDWVVAAENLRNAGLRVNRQVSLVPDEAPENTILQTNPSPGTTVERDTIVTLTASQGRQEEPEQPETRPAPQPGANDNPRQENRQRQNDRNDRGQDNRQERRNQNNRGGGGERGGDGDD